MAATATASLILFIGLLLSLPVPPWAQNHAATITPMGEATTTLPAAPQIIPPASSETDDHYHPLGTPTATKHKPDLSYSDIAVAVVTSTAAISHRLPILQQSWINDALFPVMVITDQAYDHPIPLTTLYPTLDIRLTRCSPDINGLICKTRQAFDLLAKSYPGKKWYLRLMDDTLVIGPNLLYQLHSLDPTKPW